MKFCDERIQKHLLNGGKIRRKLGSCNIIANISENGFIYDNSKTFYIFCKEDLTADDWEIVEPEYDWDKIIKDKVLCVFWDSDDCVDDIFYTLGYLTGFNNERSLRYQRHSGDLFDFCKPFNPAEFNIAKDLKEYEK